MKLAKLISFRIDESLLDMIDRLAEKEDRSRADVIRKLLHMVIPARLEDWKGFN